jgi:23S rRNA (adenine2503-C2)-methyltransferase
MINLLDLTRDDLEAFFLEQGEKKFRATQVMKWIYHFQMLDFLEMTNLTKKLRQQLSTSVCLTMPQIVQTQISQDGTRKWLLQLADGNRIEMVFIPEDDRKTLCVSSQVGCALECGFCATARQGFNRNLTTAEIVAQLWLAEYSLRFDGYPLEPHGRIISNVVFMGMGEPLINFQAVVKAMQIMMDDFGFGLSKYRLTISTAGIVPAIKRLKEQCPVNLAISLHAPNDALRDQLVPINKKYSLSELIPVCHAYVKNDRQRKVTFEYIMLKDINDTPSHAREFVKLIRNLPAKINLIPFNPFPSLPYQRSLPEVIERFREILQAAGLVTVTRKTRGADIDAACGQLVGKVEDKTRRQFHFAIYQGYQ